eukprot:TRINITY_DN5195_c0_g1_i3.p1 TRINITY_DN5195_c0_g1~~TRINITY_DN5195_c0_g1_i3.p1  ORF type:complete len:301 (+),score=30.84 TRINITY_DN5195_c0_g1_i3:406-1308(+)
MAWASEAYPEAYDLLTVPVFGLFFFGVRFLLDKLLFENLSRRCILGSFEILNRDEQLHHKKQQRKFKESTWKCLYFLSAVIFEFSVIYKESWFMNTKAFWIGPGEHIWPDQKVKKNLKMLYLYTGGFYIYSIFAIMFWETRRRDFVVSAMHHVATLVLIMSSYVLRLSRIGSIVLFLHDICDVLLEFSKMVNYMGLELVPTFTFAGFLVSWVVLRLIYYPYGIIRSTSYEVLLFVDKQKLDKAPLYYYCFNTLLLCLLVCNFYWGVLAYRVLAKTLQSGGKLQDVRSDSESEDEMEDKSE